MKRNKLLLKKADKFSTTRKANTPNPLLLYILLYILLLYILYITFLTNWKKFFKNTQNWMKTKFITAMKVDFQQIKGVALSVLRANQR